MTLNLPIIDISALQSDDISQWSDVITAIDKACRDTGFFYITGHGIPKQQFDSVQSMANTFFSLPEFAKQKINIQHSSNHRGWGQVSAEKLDPNGPSDHKETFDMALDLSPYHPQVARCSQLYGPNQYPNVDGVLFFRVLDPYKATYGVDDYVFAVTQLSQTTMRSELGKMELDKTFEERDVLNTNIVASINEAAGPWGIQVLRYEIKDIVPPTTVMEAMETQMKAERVKRAQILESEGDRQAAINVAEGQKQSVVLQAQAEKEEQVLRAQGEAEAIIAVAEAQAEALNKVGEAANTESGQKAIQLDLATKAIQAKAAIAKESSVVLLPDSGNDAASMVAQAMTIITSLNKDKG
ncbi:2-oxoglutarate and iron-dependent oxygenase domain-containing protein [Psychromonas arctica]|uniref:2-oxoglutarate and iron-dependent oxygenase domain-containing protein n=1 Tax=Psychromonas arctica TaxID=168275 RepID=UPI002FD1B96D